MGVMRHVVRRLHRWCGLLLAVLLLLSGLTGSLLAFEHELDDWINPALFEAQETGTPLDADQLIARIEASDPRLRVSLLLLDQRLGHSVQAQVAARPGTGDASEPLSYNRVFIDPVTGQILGKRLWGAWVFDRVHALPLVNRLHRTLTLPGRWGNWLLGGAALGWLGLSLMGLFLSLPQMPKKAKDLLGPAAPRAGMWLEIKRFWLRWSPSWRIKRDAAGYRLAHDVHRAVGLWTLPLAFAFAFTGVYLNLANEVFKPIVGWVATLTPPPLSVLVKTPAAGNASSDRSLTLSAVDAIERARAQLPAAAAAFQPWYLSHVAGQGVYRVAFKEPGFRKSAWRVRSEQVFIDDRSGTLRGLTGYDSGQASDRFLMWQYPVHTGKALGWAGRALAAVGGLAVALLCGVGIWQWWLRSRKQRGLRGRAADSVHTGAARRAVRIHRPTDSDGISAISAMHESSTS